MRIKSIETIPHDKCTGCSSCYNRCPRNAIAMKVNDEGFLFPVVGDNCIDCGICLNSCPVNKPANHHKNTTCYAVWASEDIRAKSSSGGMFTLLATSILEQGGAVCGASFSPDYLSVQHTWVENLEHIGKLRGSKYVQSEIGTTYTQAEQFLKAGRKVLFSGCPCQIAGLYSFLGKDYPNLITADIICHGVPSPLAYKKYLEEKAGTSKILKIDFREKSHFGWGTATSLFLDNGSVYRGDCFKDPFCRGFLGRVIVRKNCGTCPYARLERVGDFTIGDFWGVAAIDPTYDDKKGTSLVFANSPKAKEYFAQVRDTAILAEEVPHSKVAEIAKTRNGQLLHPTPTHHARTRFFEFLLQEPFAKAFEHALGKYDVGYVGWWDSKNYGSALTCFAMNRVLKKLGKSVLMLEHPGIIPSDSLKDSYGYQFAQHFFDCSKITHEKNFRRFNDVCDTFIVGSDQLWATWNHKSDSSNYFFLDFVNKNHKKIAYATSFASDTVNYPEHKRLKVGYLMSRFNGISVREESGVKICRNSFSADAAWVMDPVFLCGVAAYNEVISYSKHKPQGEYIFVYILDATPDKLEAIKWIAQERRLKYKIAVDGQKNLASVKAQLQNDPNILVDLRIEDWLAYLSKSSFVVTDSFHAFCFSMIFQKEMVAFTNPLRGKSRFDSIAKVTGLTNRVVESFNDVINKNLARETIDFNNVHSRLSVRIDESIKWLIEKLEEKYLGPNVNELHYWKLIESEKRIYELERKIEQLEKLITKK